MDASQMLRIFRTEEKRSSFESALNTIAGAMLRDLENRFQINYSRRSRMISLNEIIKDIDTEWQKFAREVAGIKIDGFRKLVQLRWIEKMDDVSVQLTFREAIRLLPPIKEREVVVEE